MENFYKNDMSKNKVRGAEGQCSIGWGNASGTSRALFSHAILGQSPLGCIANRFTSRKLKRNILPM